MRSSFFSRSFPPPRYLEVSPVAIDLSDRLLKFVVVGRMGDKLVLERWGEKELPPGSIEAGRIKNADAVIRVLAEVAQGLTTKYAVISLPEEPGFTFSLDLPLASGENLRQAVELQLEENIPLPASGVLFDYEVLSSEGTYKLAVSVFPKNLAMQYAELAVKAGLLPVAFEMEGQSAARAVARAGSHQGAALVADLGRLRSSFFIVCGGRVLSSMTLSEIGGDLLTQAAAKRLGVPVSEAENLKQSRGLLQSQDGSLLEAILPAVSVLRDEIKNFVEYWDSRASDLGQEKVNKAILCGGQSLLPGLTDYLAASLGFAVDLGKVWTDPIGYAEVPPLTKSDSLRYAVALGLALRKDFPGVNLLSPESLKTLSREYARRLWITSGLLGGAAIAVILTLSFSAIFVSKTMKAEPPVATNIPQSEIDPALSAKIDRLLAWHDGNQAPTKLFELISAKADNGITLDGMLFSAPGPSLELSGKAAARRDLLDFIDKLKQEPTFSSVESPVSNLIKDRDVPFTITLSVAKREAKSESTLLPPSLDEAAKINSYFLTGEDLPFLFEKLEGLAGGLGVKLELTQAELVEDKSPRLRSSFLVSGNIPAVKKFLTAVESIPSALSFAELRLNKVSGDSKGIETWRAQAIIELLSL